MINDRCLMVFNYSYLLTQYIPHGHCYLWQTPLLLLHIIGDLLIALAYFAISGTLVYFVSKREDIPFKNIFILFSIFILSCGTTHVIEIITLWYPLYWLSGVIKAITALVSVITASELIPLIPKALALPSLSNLEALNQEISQLNKELEKRVESRTISLEEANKQLKETQQIKNRILDLSPNIIYIFDLIEGKNIYCNQFIYDILGHTPEYIKTLGNTLLSELIHPLDIEKVAKHFEKCSLIKSDRSLEIVYRMKDSLGEWHWLCSRDTVLEKDERGKAKKTLGIAFDITEQKNSQLSLETANVQLAQQVKQLQIRNQEMILLKEINEFMQVCQSLEEAKKTLADLLLPLFYGASGVLLLMNNSHDALEEIASWGNISTEKNFFTDECWALRKGNIHYGKPETPNLYCDHIKSNSQAKHTICIPMLAQGKILGLLHLASDNSQFEKNLDRTLIETITQQISLAISNLKLRETLQFHSLRDPLTKLFNRRYLEEALTREINRAVRNKTFIGIILIDVDYFKKFNDTYGHDAGDLVLVELGKYLRNNIRNSDIACRYGGEEFILVLPDSSLENTVMRAESIREGVKKLEIQYENNLLKITISLGVSNFPDRGLNKDDLITAADRALYDAKKQGRDRVCLA